MWFCSVFLFQKFTFHQQAEADSLGSRLSERGSRSGSASRRIRTSTSGGGSGMELSLDSSRGDRWHFLGGCHDTY